MGPFLDCDLDDAGVVKLVDAEDSKSSDPCGRVGSIPTSGTNRNKPINIDNLLCRYCNVKGLRTPQRVLDSLSKVRRFQTSSLKRLRDMNGQRCPVGASGCSIDPEKCPFQIP